jgi:membrane dipeptidase
MSFTLSKEFGRYPESKVKLSKNEEDRAMGLHEKSIVFDLHMHSVIMPERSEEFMDWFRSLRPVMGYEGIKKGGITAMFDGFASISQLYHKWNFDETVMEIGLRLCDIDHAKDRVMRGMVAEDARTAKKTGRAAVYVMTENAQHIGNDLERIDFLYGLGVRGMTLAYNKRNQIADGRAEGTDSGLSEFGHEVVKRMNEVGMIIDTAHASAKTTKDAAETSEDPIVLSHSGAAALVPGSKRLASDEELMDVAGSGGLVGVHAGPNLLSKSSKQGIDDVIKHVKYIEKLIGVDNVCIGSDNFFGDKNAFHEYVVRTRPGMGLGKYLKFDAPYMEGIENPSEWPNITRGLVREGYSDQEIQKILGLNVLGLVEKVIG